MIAKFLGACLCLLWGSGAFALFYLPVGHREAFMANTGAAMAVSPGNVLLNPAGLGFRTSRETDFTMGGYAVGQQQFSVSDYQSDPEEISVRTLLAVGATPLGAGTCAVYIANPVAFDFYGDSVTTQGGKTTESFARSRNQAIIAGLAYAESPRANFAWGLGGGVVYSSHHDYTYTDIVQMGVSADSVFGEVENKRTEFFVNPGFLWKLNEKFSVGVSAYLRPFMIFSNATEETFTQNSGATTINRQKTTWKPAGHGSSSLRLGQELNLTDTHHLYFDVSYADGGISENSDGSKSAEPPAWFYGVGWRGEMTEKWELLAGYQFSEDPTGSISLGSGGGVGFQKRSSEFILGAYWAKSQSHDTSVAGYSGYGILFSANVTY